MFWSRVISRVRDSESNDNQAEITTGCEEHFTTTKYYQCRKQLAAACPEAPPRIRVASSGITKIVRTHARLGQISRTESVAGGWRWWMVEGRGRVATKGTAIAGAESVVASSRGVVVEANPGIAFRQRGLARTRTPGWPGVLPWIRRSRLDIDKWLAEGEPNTTLLLHMQGHPFVRTWVRGKREDKNFDCHAFLDHNQRNKVHFHGITISSNWHLQQHRDYQTETQGENSVQGMRANRKYQAAASFLSSFFFAFVAILLHLATVLLPSTSLRCRRPPAAFHLPCPFSFKRELDSVLFFLYSSLIPKHPSITNFDVWRSKKSSLEHSKSITLFVLLEPSFRPFHFASTSETSEVGDPQQWWKHYITTVRSLFRNWQAGTGQARRDPFQSSRGTRDFDAHSILSLLMAKSFSFANSGSYRRDHNDDDGKKTTKKGRQEKGGGSVFADPLSGASAPDSPFTPEARGWFGVESGRRREADKRIALSSRNDIFDQHFHITPAEALSRITPLSYSRILRLLSSLFYFLPFPPSRFLPLLFSRLTGGGQLVLLFSPVLRFLSHSLYFSIRFILPYALFLFLFLAHDSSCFTFFYFSKARFYFPFPLALLFFDFPL
ncbi:hypothetical protein ALC56_09004 [Trachymyrmex septentrionalis]|uniref:Uncharacterized protein n=1 Tax=Trachymyrmex septentrionalis TaxID=34720 RepID=A0A195F9V5_9HYME|nr:hypothetical protein ALC56_09004 [Trachymyrmex septentrionalis]